MPSPQALDHDTEAALRRFLSLLGGRFPVGDAILFGSRARRTHEPDSDADLALVMEGERQATLPLTLALADVAYDVLLETGLNITPLPIWREQWEHPETHRNPALLRNIDREGIRL